MSDDSLKQKYALWFSKEQAKTFSDIYEDCHRRDGRTNWSEIIKELMGFPVEEGKKPLVTEQNRALISGRIAGLQDDGSPLIAEKEPRTLRLQKGKQREVSG